MLFTRSLGAITCLALSMFVAACGGNDDGLSWVDASGSPVPESTVGFYEGHEHCGWEDSTWLYFAGDHYLKDPRHVVYGPGDIAFPRGEPRTATPDDLYQTATALPPGAHDTGLRSGETELWVSPSEQNTAVYLVSDGLIERLPFTRHGCD